MSGTPTVTLFSFAPEHHPASYRFEGLVEEVAARTPEEVIPALKLTDQGLVDVEQFKIVDLFV